MNLFLLLILYLIGSALIVASCGVVAAFVVSLMISLDEQKEVSPWYLIRLSWEEFKKMK
jgi:hypothetical protein